MAEMESFARLILALVLSGNFALAGQQPKTAADLLLTWKTASAANISIWEKHDGDVVKDYDVDMLYRMHLIVVRSDFQQFFHIHPKYDAVTGRFTSTLPIDRSHSYYVYADTWPNGLGQQVFRFTVNATAPGATTAPVSTSASDVNQPAGPYVIRLGTTTLKANREQMLPIDILLNGKPATNVHPYLEASGHAVFVNAQSLAYYHVHPVVRNENMDMTNMPTVSVGVTGPRQLLHTPALAAGNYKFWYQFRGGKKLYVATYTIVVR